MAEYESGTAFIQFVGSFRGLVEAVTKEATKDGQLFAQTFNREVEKGLRGLDLGPSGAASAKDGAEAGSRYAEGFKARVAASGAKVKVDADTSAATAKLAALDKQAKQTANSSRTSLIGALAAIAPATVPLVATAGGALAGLIPLAATVAFGIKGINDELKDGSLAGTQYAKDLNQIKAEGQSLQGIAAGGLLAGVDKGLAASHGLFGEVNRDVAIMSGQLGTIVAGSAPALLTILQDLNPLFVTFGNIVASGATHLESWAENSDGIEHFVAYVQSELPDVERLLSEVATLFGHLAEGAAPFGGVLLRDIDDLVGALDAIPIGVLQTAIPLAVSLYVALKAYALLKPAISGVATGVTKLGAAIERSDANSAAVAASAAATREAAYQGTAAAKAQEAAQVAAANAAEAEAAAEVAVDEAAAAEARGAVDAGLTRLIAENAIEQAAARRAEALAAEQTAAAVAASAIAAAEASETAAATSSIAWGSMLGPVGALVVGGGLLATMFLHSGAAARQMQEDVNALTDAIKEDSGAIGENTRTWIVNNLQKSGALDAARTLGLNLNNLTNLVIQGGPALKNYIGNLRLFTVGVWGAKEGTHAQSEAAHTLIDALGGTNTALGRAKQAYDNEQAAMGSTTAAARSQKAELDRLNTTLGTTISNLLSAAQSEDQFLEAVRNVTKSVHDNGDSLSKNTAHGLANRDALLSAMQAALSYRDAQEKSGVSTRKANQTLADNIAQLEQSAIHAGLSKSAVHALVRQMDLVPKNIRTKFDANTAQARQQARAYIRWLQSLPTVTIGVDFAANRRSTRSSQVPGSASGTNGRGLPRGVSAVGERGPELAVNDGSRVEILSNTQSRAFLAMTGMTAPGFAGGTASHIGPGGSDARITDLISSGFFGIELIKALHQLGLQVTATTRGVAASVRAVAREAQRSVSRQIAAAVAPAVTSIPGLREQLTRGVSRATTDRERLDIAKRNLDVLNKHAQALKHDASELQNQAKQAHYAASQMETGSKAASAAKKAAEEQARALKHQADAAGKVADAVGKMADRGRAAYEKLKEAAQSASQKAQQEAQALIAAVQSEFDTLQQNIQAFESGISQSLTAGSDLSTIWGQLSSNVDSAKQALDAAQSALDQASSATAGYAQAQQAASAAAAQLAAAQQALTAAQASGDVARIAAAQQQLTAAMTASTNAHAALAAVTPTADQLAAQAQAQQQLTAAQQAYNQALQAQSASGVSGVLGQYATSEKQFSDDLSKLKALIGNGPAAKSLITELAGLGAQGGDALAEGLINDPRSRASVLASMKRIQSIADTEGDTLAAGFFGAGVKAMEQLLKGIEKQFPETKAAVDKLLNQLSGEFGSSGSPSNSTGSAAPPKAKPAKTVTIDHIHQLQTVAKMYGISMTELVAANPSLKGDHAKSPIRKGTKLKIPQFASGVENFDGGLAYVHKNELLVNLSKGTSVYPQITPAAQLPASALAGDSGTSRLLTSIDRKLDALANLPIYGPAIKQALDASTATHDMIGLVTV